MFSLSRTLTIAVALAFCTKTSFFAQSKAPAGQQAPTVSVPFVGCESDGQTGPVEAPSGKSKVVTIAAKVAERLAYYQSGQGLGVLAPRGWYCFGTYGSNGEALNVSARPINKTKLFSSEWSGFDGLTVQIVREYGGTSGRFGVASVIARVFPARKSFVDAVLEEEIAPTSSFAFGPYPGDKLVYKSQEIVEYETPAQAEGLGTHFRLKKSDLPISGVAILVGETPDLIQLAARLPPDLADLSSPMIQQVEKEAEHSSPR